jgi:hypothetical protein
MWKGLFRDINSPQTTSVVKPSHLAILLRKKIAPRIRLTMIRKPSPMLMGVRPSEVVAMRVWSVDVMGFSELIGCRISGWQVCSMAN